jgi:outer membrane protein TolC
VIVIRKAQLCTPELRLSEHSVRQRCGGQRSWRFGASRGWLLSFVMAALAVSLQGQTSAPGSSRIVSAGTGSTIGTASQNSGSVPSGTATGEVLRLTLRDAITKAVRYNLGAIESGENARDARGQRLLALSDLLPRVTAGATETVTKVSLVPSGITQTNIIRIPSVIGPFAYSEAGGNLELTLFSYESIQRFRAARSAEDAAKLSYNDTLDVITLTVGSAYLQVIETSSRITAQEAQVRNAQASYEQALHQFDAGTAPRIDVTRTQVQLRTEQYNLSVTRNNFAIAKLVLSRAIGLPLGQAFEIADALPYAEISPPSVDEALSMAFKTRSDFLAARTAQKSAERALSAAKAQRYPAVSTNGSYSAVGPTFSQSSGTYTFQAGISVPIFTGGQIEGDITQAEAALRQRSAEAENVRGQIDYDVRTAFLNLNAATEQVTVARQNVELANESLSRSKDRFASGVTDSVEVVQSEQSVASANDQYISALYNHNLAKLSLARSLGVARTNYSQYLGGK